MTPIQLLALRVAVMQALKEKIEAAEKEHRRQLLETLQATGAEKVGATLPSGARVASVTVTGAGKAKATVTDPAAFLDWVKTNRPNEVEERVRSSYQRAVLAEVQTTGEIVPGVELTPAAPGLLCKPTKDGKDAIAHAWQTGMLNLPELLALPSGGDDSER